MKSYTILLSFIYCFIFERKSSILCRKKQILIGRWLTLQLYGARCSAWERKCIINTNCSIRKRSKRPDIHSIFKVLVKDNATNVAWYEEGSEVTPFKSGLLFNLDPPVIQGSKVPPLPPLRSHETVLMLRWKRAKFEFDQPYKQTKCKLQITGKISSNK